MCRAHKFVTLVSQFFSSVKIMLICGQNLTEFNTAHNRRIAVMGDIPDVPQNPLKRKRRVAHVRINEEEEVINPEDIDPSIGRFRNLVQTTVIPKKVRVLCSFEF